MLRLILRDLRNMLRRPVVSLLLLIGLIVGGFAMVVYFVSSSQELKLQRYISGEENVGDSVRVAGRAFEVVGLMPADAGYAPYAYDMRRLPQGSEHVAGTELEELDAQLRQRPLRALIIPMDVFAELGLEPDYCHISFMEDISGIREQVEASLSEQVGISKFTDMTQFMEVSRINQISRALLYAAAVLAGLINIVSLYAF